MRILPLIIWYLFSAVLACATTYYIDYEGGSDDANGTSPQTAWKHSPGDKNATGNPKAVELKPGDVVTFKGGVQYLGELHFKDLQGAAGNPIVFDGNSAGNYGSGPAVLDGAKMITGWKNVASADQVDGNPKWKEIMYADVDMDLSSNFSQDRFILHRDGKADRQAPWQRLFLIDGEKRVMPIAQRPKPSDPFFPDLPKDFYESPIQMVSSYPHKIYYPEGSKGNRTLPVIGITYGSAPVVEPLNGGEVALDLAQPETIAEIGVKLFRPKSSPAPETVAFYADGEEVYEAQIDPSEGKMQRFKLDQPVKASTITFQLRAPNAKKRWTKIQQLAAYTPSGDNIMQHDITTVIEDPVRLTQKDPNWYDDIFVGAHGGNNHVYFAKVRKYDPTKNQLHVPHFTSTIYKTTKYALFNSPKFIDLPGEWALEPIDGGKTRVYLLPETLKDGQPVNIGYPVLRTAWAAEGNSAHLAVRGFLMQRYAGGKGGVAVNGRTGGTPSNIHIADCEIRFMSGQSGISLNYSENITVENCYVHHCPGWTVGIYVNRITGYNLLGTRIDNNSGSGIRHYEAKQGVLKNNMVINHYGMHSSGLNFYEGCRDIQFEDNYIENVIAINRSAENLNFRNNVINGMGTNAVTVAMWVSGKVGGTHMKNLTFENNTFINCDTNRGWYTAIFVQKGNSPPEGLVAKNNILSRLTAPFPGDVENNIYLHETDAKVAGKNSMVVTDQSELFRDPENGDFRRKPGGPMMNSGADVPPPPKQWSR